MFGQKSRKIKWLETSLKIWRDSSTGWEKDYRSADAARHDAVENLLKSVNQNRGYEETIERMQGCYDALQNRMDFALNESKELNQALEDENRDLARQLELLQSLLGQLQVKVTLPRKRG